MLIILLVAASKVWAVDSQGDRFDLFGDFRVRLEQDWDSLKGDGTKRDDRLRLRIRVRTGIDFKINEQFSARASVRSGPKLSQQSPHITVADFDGGETGPYEFNFDYWYLKFADGGLDAWVGRNELSFWHQDDLFVFDNVTYPGVGASYRHRLGKANVAWHLNYVALPVGMRETSGTGIIGQLVYDRDFGNSGFTIAAGFASTRADPDDPAGEILLTENNLRDYDMFDLMLQYRSKIFGKPYYLGFDYSHNFRNYDNEPTGSFSDFHKDAVDGYVVEMEWGDKEKAGDWLFGYYYSYLEALAVHSSYIADDWVRWGNANQVRATNLKGSEFRVRYTIRPNMNVFARLFLVDAIDLLEPGDTTKETGNRLRIDFNVSF